MYVVIKAEQYKYHIKNVIHLSKLNYTIDDIRHPFAPVLHTVPFLFIGSYRFYRSAYIYDS